MDGVRKHFGVGLLLLTCALTSHCSESAPVAVAEAAAASAGRDAPLDLRLVLIVRHVEDSRSHLGAKTEAPLASRAWTFPTGSKDLRNLKTARRVKAVGE